MGLLKKLLVVIIACLAVTFLPGLPPYGLHFTPYIVTPSRPFEGELALNRRLDKTEHLFEGQLKGPECFASKDGQLYTGIVGGQIVRVTGDKLVPVAKFGQPCDGYWEEHICGRPLGMRFGTDGLLYVADAYYGIHKVNVKTGAVTKLVSMSVPISGDVPAIPNSVAVATDGLMYWSDSVTGVALHDAVISVMADGNGRLLRYDPKTNTSQVLIDKLYCANGVALSAGEDFVVVAELHKSRLLRYYLKGPKMGSYDVFLDGIPGLPDNLASDGKGGFLVALTTVSSGDHAVLTQTIAPYPNIRKFLARFLTLIELPFQMIDTIYPNHYTKRVIHLVGNTEPLMIFVPNNIAGFLHVDSEGRVTDSLWSQDGSLSAVSEVHLFNGAYYLGSYTNNYIGRVKMTPTQGTAQRVQ